MLPPKSITISSRDLIGYIAIPTVEFCTNQGCKSIELGPEYDPDFTYYSLCFHVERLKGIGEGTTFAKTSKTAISRIEIPFPLDRGEQTEIAKILCGVDAAIERTEDVIVKQRRIKKGLPQELLTKGIDQDGRVRSERSHQFQDSPLGRIPVEWNIDRIGRVADKITSGSRGWARYYSEEGALFIRIGNLTREHINLRFDDVILFKPPQDAEGSRTRVEAGDVLISITADLGIIAVIPEGFGEAYINQHISLARLASDEINPRWAGHFMQGHAFQQQVDKANESGAKAGLNLPTVSRFLLAYPQSPEEQEAIVERLDLMDQAIADSKAQLSKLRRLKAGLMRDLLSGKVRVPVERAEHSEAVEAAA